VNVEWIERTLARPIEPLRLRIDPPCLLRDVLDADGDLHGARLYSRRKGLMSASEAAETFARVERFEREPER
jgi:hypothetical protein